MILLLFRTFPQKEKELDDGKINKVRCLRDGVSCVFDAVWRRVV
jgi:hypothetical protein